MKQLMLSLAVLLAAAISVQAQDAPTGVWKTVDDETGEAKSHVEIYKDGGMYHGKITKLLESSQDEVCDACPGSRKGKKLVGMVIVNDLEPYKDYWKNGTIMDPETGNEYGCSVWFEEGKPDELKVRGKHWTGVYRTQTWYRVR
ncbi:DUF2147 domain-containing protein [Phaeodactylibacter sp.]|jgi:uncharacterized protein (DUF2147 family)|uniref:DUF2147 domain-containing protein n=1 Tax=Phaeodactylibacter sp. TaxID=1940289 RepID=UPI0025DBFE6C|nr:DUF2147 domain-containing protein [Phaeodactylibacter sp.]MCI4651726.1 DUF2147 domain-containing protein [Phaeodactylibacter sp.]MCI5090818.1 DUF2147 domain-containing protein [Phaeodactylibacter sp.]